MCENGGCGESKNRLETGAARSFSELIFPGVSNRLPGFDHFPLRRGPGFFQQQSRQLMACRIITLAAISDQASSRE